MYDKKREFTSIEPEEEDKYTYSEWKEFSSTVG